MADYRTERYRRGNTWRATENLRDDDLGDPWDDERGSRWMGQDDWLPESSDDRWENARQRQRLAPGQTSDGGPAPSGYRRGDQGNEYGSDLRYGLNGGYGNSPEDDQAWRSRQQYQSRSYASEVGDYGDLGDGGDFERQGGVRRHGGAGGSYGNDAGYGGSYGGYGQSGQRQQGFGNADQEWLRRAEQREPRYGGGSGRQGSYFNDLRSDTRYWTESTDEWGESRPSRAQSYGRDYLGSQSDDRRHEGARGYAARGGTWRNDDDGRYGDDRRDRYGDDDEDHGMLYNIGHRIGQAFSDWFGTDDDTERRSGPRGYTRTDDRIRDEICERLTFTSGVDVSEVTVDVENGKVTLGGTVQRRSQKYDIEDMADNTFGVNEVENNIRVQRQDATSAAGAGFNGW
ncbi:BON domain-containing protein [Cupriavidus agavae]|uniref:BON domain-containing protein n=1 Tax=Cupriavidus agavae TaxID=1001822 RepID=A0A4Q7S1S5_9BURK|nr:BON domain-containing protein [Cupriavidus agavae]RZT39487.1 BON domain-containing protein [Cupriavidus agavae]